MNEVETKRTSDMSRLNQAKSHAVEVMKSSSVSAVANQKLSNRSPKPSRPRGALTDSSTKFGKLEITDPSKLFEREIEKLAVNQIVCLNVKGKYGSEDFQGIGYARETVVNGVRGIKVSFWGESDSILWFWPKRWANGLFLPNKNVEDLMNGRPIVLRSPDGAKVELSFNKLASNHQLNLTSAEILGLNFRNHTVGRSTQIGVRITNPDPERLQPQERLGNILPINSIIFGAFLTIGNEKILVRISNLEDLQATINFALLKGAKEIEFLHIKGKRDLLGNHLVRAEHEEITSLLMQAAKKGKLPDSNTTRVSPRAFIEIPWAQYKN